MNVTYKTDCKTKGSKLKDKNDEENLKYFEQN